MTHLNEGRMTPSEFGNSLKEEQVVVVVSGMMCKERHCMLTLATVRFMSFFTLDPSLCVPLAIH